MVPRPLSKWEPQDCINLVIVVGLLVIGGLHEIIDIMLFVQTKSFPPDILGTSIVTGLLGYMGGRHMAAMAAKGSQVNTGPDTTVNVQPETTVTQAVPVEEAKQDGV